MTETEFLENIKEEMLIEDREIQLTDSFRDYPEWTSLTFLTLVAFIDSEFDKVLSADDLSGCFTLQDIWNFANK